MLLPSIPAILPSISTLSSSSAFSSTTSAVMIFVVDAIGSTSSAFFS